MRHALAFLYACLLLLVAPACGGGAAGSVVVGLTSDLRVGVDIDQVHVVMRAAGAVVTDEILSTSSAAHPLVLPTELRFPDLPGGTAVEVTLEALAPADTTPLLTRLAATTIVAGETLLLPVVLDSRCVVEPGSSAPVCAAPETCIAGVCESESVAPSTLEPYSPNWASASTDPCKPPGGGAPVVIVGEGQDDYLPLANGAVDQVEQGPQGGHHVWVALRAKNLSQSGSITSVTGTFPDLGVDVGPFNVIFTMEIDEGGFCKLYGLRFQLDQVVNIDTLLGHPLDMTVTVTDPEMDVGVGKLDVVLSQTYLQ
jgi:hypothetical protein